MIAFFPILNLKLHCKSCIALNFDTGNSFILYVLWDLFSFNQDLDINHRIFIFVKTHFEESKNLLKKDDGLKNTSAYKCWKRLGMYVRKAGYLSFIRNPAMMSDLAFTFASQVMFWEKSKLPWFGV